MKRLLSGLLLMLLVLTAGAAPAYGESGQVLVDGKAVTLSSAPTVVDGILMLPLRDVVEPLGDTFAWTPTTNTATITHGKTIIEVTPGRDTARFNGQLVHLPAAVMQQGDRILAPAGFLLTLYGHRLTINAPGLIDPAAMALVEQTRTVPGNLDFAMKQSMTVQSTQGAMTTTMAMDGFVRGQDALLSVTMQMGEHSATVRSAMREGQQYVRVNQTWSAVPANPALQQAIASLAAADTFKLMVREAHLGTARMEQGQKLQEVAVTFDPAVIQATVDQIVGQITGPLKDVHLSISYESMSGTFTIDPATQTQRGYTMDATMTLTITVGDQTETVHATLHQTMNMVPHDTPITWHAYMH